MHRFIHCDLKATQMNVQYRNSIQEFNTIEELTLYQFEMCYNATEATEHIWDVKVESTLITTQ